MADENLDNEFNLEEGSNEITFFEDETVSLKSDDVVQEVLDEEGNPIAPTTDEDKAKAELEEEQEITSSMYATPEDEDEEGEGTPEPLDDDEEEEGTSATQTSDHLSNLNYLKERGIISDFEIEEGTEITEELAAEILEDKYEESVESRVEELMKDLHPSVKALNKFVLNGGDVNQFMDTLVKNKLASSATGFNAKSDIEKEDVQEAVVRHDLAKEGFDNEYIDSQIEFLKTSNKLKTVSEKKFNKFVEQDNLQQQQLVKQAENKKRADKEAARQRKTNITGLLEKEEINGMTFSEDEKKSLPAFMSDRNIKMKNGTSITPMQKKLYEVLNDEEKSLQLAKLLNSDFDMSEFSTDANTRVASQVRNNLQNNNKPNRSKTQGKRTNRGSKSLASYFND